MATDVTHNEGPGGLPEPGEASELARGKSLLEQARAKRSKRESHLFIDVPSWDGDLVAEYRVLGSKELEVIAENAGRRIRSGEHDPVHSELDLIAKANVGLYTIDPESGDRVSLEDEHGLVGYNRIAQMLGIDNDPEIKPKVDSVVKAIKYLTGERKEDGEPGEWQENPTAITQHANRIGRWMRDPSKSGVNILEEILGEF